MSMFVFRRTPAIDGGVEVDEYCLFESLRWNVNFIISIQRKAIVTFESLSLAHARNQSADEWRTPLRWLKIHSIGISEKYQQALAFATKRLA